MKKSFFSIDPKLEALGAQCETACQEVFLNIDAVANHNSDKVLSAFIECGISESHFAPSSGYGYDDRGREVTDKVYAQIFGCEDALVRHNFVSGTHALTTALFGVLRTGDTMVSLTGKPYDTMEGVIGIRGQGDGSLKDYGIHYRQLDLKADGTVDLEGIAAAVKGAKIAYIQRSCGYEHRDSINMQTMEQMVKAVKAANPAAAVVVDNCYGEFVECYEPTDVGADLIIGSLIKNPGGGIAPTGGYIAGRADLVEQCANRLTCPGMGKEVGCTHGLTKQILMGLYFAPTVVASALKTAVFAAKLYELLGFEVSPGFDAHRTDIIQTIQLGNPDGLCAFCRGIQKGSAVDSFVTPEPWDMPGYDSQVIMAAGAFNLGASIELSADAPLKEPYQVFLQGGLTYPYGRRGILLAAQSMLENHLVSVD